MPQRPPQTSTPARNRTLRAGFALSAGLLAGLLTIATPAPTPLHAAGPTGAVELAEEPFRLSSVGLTMSIPEEASVQSSRVGADNTARIVPDSGEWLINIQTPRTTRRDTSLERLAEGVIDQLKISVGVRDPDGAIARTEAEVIKQPEKLQIGGQDAIRFYVSMPGSRQSRALHGYTAFRVTDTRFVIFELITPDDSARHARPLYETVVATARFEDPATIAADRGAAVERGLIVLDNIDEEDFKRVLERNDERWERLYRPASTDSDADAEELGYRRIRARIGHRGELNPNRSEDRWSSSEREEGYLLQMDVRLLHDNGIIDSSARYFMTPDRDEESWNVRMAMRQNNRTATWTETGARNGTSMSVRIEEGSGPSRQIRPLIQGDGYITQVEAFLLPSLLVEAGIKDDFAFYTYRTRAETIRLRRDTLDKPESRPGTWRLTTKLGEDDEPQTTILNSDGKPIRTRLPDGTIWETIELNRLVELWRSKDLPMD